MAVMQDRYCNTCGKQRMHYFVPNPSEPKKSKWYCCKCNPRSCDLTKTEKNSIYNRRNDYWGKGL